MHVRSKHSATVSKMKTRNLVLFVSLGWRMRTKTHPQFKPLKLSRRMKEGVKDEKDRSIIRMVKTLIKVRRTMKMISGLCYTFSVLLELSKHVEKWKLCVRKNWSSLVWYSHETLKNTKNRRNASKTV